MVRELRNQLAGSPSINKAKDIDQFVLNKVKEARKNLYVVRGHMIQDWALDYARSIDATRFKAGHSWLDAFKKRHRIGGRSITKRTSRAQ